MSAGRRLAAAVVSTLLLGACTAGYSDAPGSQTPTTSGGSPTTSSAVGAPPIPEAPTVGACYRLTLDELSEPSNDSEPVPCGEKHNAETIHVGRLDTVVDGHAVAVDSEHVIRQLATKCPRRLARHLGGTAEDRDLTRFEVVWFSPTLDEADQGASWYRCDVIAFAKKNALLPLPAPRRLASLLDDSNRAAAYGLCGTAAPGAANFARVACGRPHSWRAVATLPIRGGKAYPGQRAVRAAGDATCSDRVRAQAENPLRFRYGWEWPTKEQWHAGQRFGYCWAPKGD